MLAKKSCIDLLTVCCAAGCCGGAVEVSFVAEELLAGAISGLFGLAVRNVYERWI